MAKQDVVLCAGERLAPPFFLQLRGSPGFLQRVQKERLGDLCEAAGQALEGAGPNRYTPGYRHQSSSSGASVFGDPPSVARTFSIESRCPARSSASAARSTSI